MSYRKIPELYDVSKSGISHTIKRFYQRKTIQISKNTTEKADRLLVRYSKKNRRKIAVKLNTIMC